MQTVKIPGNFKVPENWPKAQPIDTITDLYFDFQADSLPVGAVAKWNSAGGTVPWAFASDASAAAPVVAVDAKGKKYLNFTGKERLNSGNLTAGVAGPMTIIMTMQTTFSVSPTAVSDHARAFSGGGNGYRAIMIKGDGAKTYIVRTNNSQEVWLNEAAPDSVASVAMRYADTGLDAKNNTGPWRGPVVPTSPVTQYQFLVGASAANPPLGFYIGKVYRIQAWRRTLTNVEVEYITKNNAEVYG